MYRLLVRVLVGRSPIAHSCVYYWVGLLLLIHKILFFFKFSNSRIVVILVPRTVRYLVVLQTFKCIISLLFQYIFRLPCFFYSHCNYEDDSAHTQRGINIAMVARTASPYIYIEVCVHAQIHKCVCSCVRVHDISHPGGRSRFFWDRANHLTTQVQANNLINKAN